MKMEDNGIEFKATTLKQAMILARATCGEDAIILSVKQLDKQNVSVRAMSARAEGLSGALSEQIRKAEEDKSKALQINAAAHNDVLFPRTSNAFLEESEESISDATDGSSSFWGSTGSIQQAGKTEKKTPALSDVGETLLRCQLDPVLAYEIGKIGSSFPGGLRDRVLKSLAFKIDQAQSTAGSLPLNDGGAFALVGPTGTGKTTTIAKLAAKGVEKWGAEKVGLITVDFYRIGAIEQLKVFAQLLGVEMAAVKSKEELDLALKYFANHKLVLVDTIGVSRNDEKAKLQMQWFENTDLNVLLCLQASLSKETLKRDVDHWYDFGVREVVATKTDEVSNIKDVLEICLLKGMSLRTITTGQRVPEDVFWVSGSVLAHKALRGVWNES